ncbi:hypothetical protein DSM100688_0275 [Bifidobacterium ramosum]|uniref:DUF4192 domain-containing protein n=1 Tax=Bifidobacterium ramosum TaxID=1798158 RepID=A0A6L4X2H9_9BIFI|nr:DUF4192 domain-containing protein [Bifidobacterium ramosum]KAB8289195.1 hypothetical protein DSM100688_0275 [Bifidobacterium ramosum]NEG70904.1 DUF4192 domain-containing protein [Bifidobacterium ramosum]
MDTTTMRRTAAIRRLDRGRNADRDGDTPFDESGLETITRRFRAARMEHGRRKADEAWVRGPFAAWLGNLAAGASDPCDATLHDDHVASIAVGMRESLPIRDALIVSLLAARPCDRATMTACAADPHGAATRHLMADLMSTAYERPDPPDFARCLAGLSMLAQIARGVPPRWRVQPIAALAYVLWWLDDDLAVPYALECLALDGDCTLAGIVVSTVERGVCPAWCR